jgi:hypothetical protein
MFTKQDGREGEKPTTGIHTAHSTRICSIFIYIQTGRMLMGSSHSCRAGSCWRWRKTGNGTNTFFFLFQFHAHPQHTRKQPRQSSSSLFLVFFWEVCLFSSLSTDHYLKSHLFFSFFLFLLFLSEFWRARVFPFFFSFSSSSNCFSYLFSRLSTLFGYRSSCCCCCCCVRIVLYEVCWIAPPPTRHRVDAERNEPC